MSEPAAGTTKKEGNAFFSMLMWWKIDSADIEKHVANYHTMKVWQSARGMSMLACAFTVVVTVLLSGMMGLSESTVITEVVIWSVLGIAMFRGQKWAFVVGMVFWTVEKAALVFSGTAAGGTPIAQILWWVAFMHLFMLGYRVEKARNAKPVVAPAPV